ncbi:methyl-accepting chemotaxis protein [Anaerocolumna xylanovorans]|uniref:Methyl-accepting chemotaxis sensory transducer with Cache sensor n=1 Tax=Anaerocolumna xylanovorans DSM 12503 TaxID=1121345 RepID=A0A1M7Y1U1_9FIRM|nr:methyl-accepting chemotaxis protein [Anaerocolumna xylanovorans]SHO45817.1 methyl-accepting chemotaxis sensory transducer with Cache sensor [Anaerocolumna xylanovorans DSM 12503]
MGFKKITSQLLTVLLTVILASMLSLSFISYSQSENIIKGQIQTMMNSELDKQRNLIETKLLRISSMAVDLGSSVEATYASTALNQYEELLSAMVKEDSLILGSGIWFEPYVYDKNEKYMGPYVYKDGDKTAVTYEYSNAEYDYFSYDWYKNAKNGTDPVFSELYYDDTLKLTMMSCTAPMYTLDKKFTGVVTVDMQVSDIQDLTNKIKLGDTGSVFLLNKDGLFITGTDADGILKENIVDSKNSSLKKLGTEIIKNEQGEGSYTESGKKYLTYYRTIPGVGWHIVAKVPEAETKMPLKDLSQKLIISLLVSVIITGLLIILQVNAITRKIKKANNFTMSLAKGDFTLEPIPIKGRNELSQLEVSLNKMLTDNKAVIQSIAGGASGISNAGESLEVVVHKLTEQFQSINTSIRDINEVMMSSSASTEEVNASVEEVHSSIDVLTQETETGKDLAENIHRKAQEAERKSEISYEKAQELIQANEKKLLISLENAKIVESIGTMAGQIAEIAEQVNLLSLNASIEAARAGEHGKGFAVVAKEIGTLASMTTHTVEDIKNTIDRVTGAYKNLMDNSSEMLEFMKVNVAGDYREFVDTAKEYDLEASAISKNIETISRMTEGIDRISSEVTKAISEIAQGAQITAESSSAILGNIDGLSEVVKEVASLIEKENEISGNLNHMVANFKING